MGSFVSAIFGSEYEPESEMGNKFEPESEPDSKAKECFNYTIDIHISFIRQADMSAMLWQKFHQVNRDQVKLKTESEEITQKLIAKLETPLQNGILGEENKKQQVETDHWIWPNLWSTCAVKWRVKVSLNKPKPWSHDQLINTWLN